MANEQGGFANYGNGNYGSAFRFANGSYGEIQDNKLVNLTPEDITKRGMALNEFSTIDPASLQVSGGKISRIGSTGDIGFANADTAKALGFNNAQLGGVDTTPGVQNSNVYSQFLKDTAGKGNVSNNVNTAGGAVPPGGSYDPKTNLTTAPSKFEQGFNQANSNPDVNKNITDPGTARAVIDQNVPKENPQNPQADVVLASNQAHQQYLNDFAQAQSSLRQNESLTQEYTRLSQQMGIQGLNTQLLNMKNIMDGSEQNIRDEITKAGGFSTDSQVLALTTARNKTMIQNYNNLLQTRDDMQKNLDTIIGLSEKDRAYASAQIDKQLNFDLQQQTYADKMLTNAQDSLNTTAKTFGWDAVLQSALATGDPQAVQRINSTMGNGFDLATMAKGNNIDQMVKEANLAHTIAETRKINFDMKQGGGGNINTTIPVTNDTGKTSYVPTNLLPYYNVSTSGVEYIDASTLQGTAAQKTALVNEASKAGYKVITNKNTAADLVNIKDANSKLDSISTIMAGIGQPGWISRSLYGLGLTKLATLTQSDPQKAAAGALQSIGLDILKAISGVQGFRGNQTAVQQVTDHLPKITDTVDTINKKISYIRTLISDREDAAVGKPKVNVVPADQVPAGYYQASDGLFYKK